MLSLRRGTVVETGAADEPMQRLDVDVDGERRPALADVSLVGTTQAGDEVVVNVAARDLGLGSGGFDVVHVNLSRGLGGVGVPGAHVMKLNYTSLQHAVLPVEGPDLALPLERPVGVTFLHGQLAPVAWAFGQTAHGSASIAGSRAPSIANGSKAGSTGAGTISIVPNGSGPPMVKVSPAASLGSSMSWSLGWAVWAAWTAARTTHLGCSTAC